MNIKLGTLESYVIGLNAQSEKRYPAKLAYAISRNKKKLMSELENMIAQRKNIVERDCIKDEYGNPVYDEIEEKLNYTYKSADIKNMVIKEINELMETEIDIEIMKVNFSVFERCDEEFFDSITASEIDIFDFMLE